MKMFNCIAVGLGGFVGAVCRYLIGLLPVKETTLFPIKTFGINVLGCIAIAVIITMLTKDSSLSPRMGLFLKVGFCGGFTTFSTFAVETADLMKGGHPGIAAAYVVLSILLGVGLVLAIQGK